MTDNIINKLFILFNTSTVKIINGENPVEYLKEIEK